MAIFHLTAKIVSRAKGQSVVAKAAYNSREKLTNENTGESHDYSPKGETAFSGIFLPNDAPERLRDRETLWSEVDKKEKRKDAQLAREVEIALPHELTDEQRRRLITDFVRENFVRKGMVADVSIHAPSPDGDGRNNHAHILLTMREVGPEGFGPKVREWNSPEQLQAWREKWANLANRYLERHGHEARIDHRSLEAQGIEREPTEHLGPSATQAEREGQQTERGDINREIEARNEERERLITEARAVALELAEAGKAIEPGPEAEQENDDPQAKYKRKLKTRVPYSEAGMVPQQRDAQRDFVKRSKRLQKRQAEQRKKAQEETERNKERQKQEKNPFADRKSDGEQKRDVIAAKTEMKGAKAEITEAQRARMERDALREKAGLRVSSDREKDGGRERERER